MRQTKPEEYFFDQTKAIMIALVIATHTILEGTLFTTDLKQIIEAAPDRKPQAFGLAGYAIHFT